MIDVRRMQILRAVVTTGSVTAAARNLGYTTSAISQQMAALERECGVKLLERVGRGVQPTPAGSVLAEHAAVIARDVADAETALAEIREGRTGLLRVRYFSTAGAALIPRAMAQFRRDLPGVGLELKLCEPEDPLTTVEQGEADIAIVVRPSRGDAPSGTSLVHLLDDPFRAVLPEQHPLAARPTLPFAALADEPWVGSEWPAGSCLEIVQAACATAGFEPRYVVESDDYVSAQGFVAAGLGIAVIPQLGLGGPRPGVAIRPLANPEPTRSIFAAVRETSLPAPAVPLMLDALRAAGRASLAPAMTARSS